MAFKSKGNDRAALQPSPAIKSIVPGLSGRLRQSAQIARNAAGLPGAGQSAWIIAGEESIAVSRVLSGHLQPAISGVTPSNNVTKSWLTF
jgi:hypothetical protein